MDIAVLIDGLKRARGRFEATHQAESTSFQAIFETLAWVGAVRDRLREDGRPIPPTLNGLYYVRNLVLHQGADVLDWIHIPSTIPGMSYPGGGTTLGWWWPTRGDMPKPQSRSGEREYDSHVSGREVRVVLAAVAAELS